MSWERVWGPTELVVVDGELGVVYAKPAPAAGLGSGMFRWDGTPFGWQAIGGEMTAAVAAGRGADSRLYGLDAAGVVHRFDDPGWTAIGGPTTGRASALHGGPDQLVAVAAEAPGDLYRWDAGAQAWVRIGGPAAKVVVGRSSDGEFPFAVFARSPDDAPADGKGIYRWSGQWRREGDAAADVWVSGSTLFATNPVSGDLLMKDVTGWKRIGGPGAGFVTDQHRHVWGLSPTTHAVHRWTGVPNQWERIGEPAAALFAGWDGMLFALDPTASDLWHHRTGGQLVGAVPEFDGVIRTQKMKHVHGARNLLVVLWDPHRAGHARPSRAAVESMIFGPAPSLRHWIEESSGGRAALVDVGVRGWYDAPIEKRGEHYWDNQDEQSADPAKRLATYHSDTYHDGWLSGHVEKWADAIRRAAQEVDLAQFDTDHDGVLSTDELAIFLCYPQNEASGYGRATAGIQVPAHQPLVVDGVRIPWIVEWYLGSPPHFGVGAHELAHLVLGTPDLYFDGFWPHAAAAFSASDQCRGQHLSAPEKLKLGWLDTTVVTGDGVYDLPAVETTDRALVVMNPRRGPDEYFLLENRWRGTSYDAGGPVTGPGIPSDGLAIWHVIEDPAVFDTVAPWPPTGVPGEWGRLGIRLVRSNGGLAIDDEHALFSHAGEVVSEVTEPAHLRWLHDEPSGVRVKLLTDAGPTMRVEIGVG